MRSATKFLCILVFVITIWNANAGKTPAYISKQFSATVGGRQLTYTIGSDALIHSGETSFLLAATEKELKSDGKSIVRDVVLKVAVNFTVNIKVDGNSYLRNEHRAYEIFQAENNKRVEKLNSPEIYYLERLQIFNTHIVQFELNESNSFLLQNTEDKKALVMAMQLMGENVGEYISNIPFTEYKRRLEVSLRVEAHILKNLKVARNAGITHNDIKAHNLVFPKKGCYDIDSIALINFEYAIYGGCYIAVAYRGTPPFFPIRVHRQFQKGTFDKLNEVEPYKPWFQDDPQSSLYWFIYATKQIKSGTLGTSTMQGFYNFKTKEIEGHINTTFTDAVCPCLGKTLLDFNKDTKPPQKEFDYVKYIGALIAHANIVAAGKDIPAPV